MQYRSFYTVLWYDMSDTPKPVLMWCSKCSHNFPSIRNDFLEYPNCLMDKSVTTYNPIITSLRVVSLSKTMLCVLFCIKIWIVSNLFRIGEMPVRCDRLYWCSLIIPSLSCANLLIFLAKAAHNMWFKSAYNNCMM
jgi:hypothetical protein